MFIAFCKEKDSQEPSETTQQGSRGHGSEQNTFTTKIHEAETSDYHNMRALQKWNTDVPEHKLATLTSSVP